MSAVPAAGSAAGGRRRRWLVLMPAAPLLVVCLGGTRAAAEGQQQVPGASAYALAAVAALTLLLRRRAPGLGVSVAALATAAYLLLGHPFGPILFAGPVWAWCLAAAMPLPRAVPWLVGFLAVVVAAAGPRLVADEGGPGVLVWATILAGTLTAGAATGFALAARSRSEAAARTEIARRAVSEERLAMAQDVHDGIGHSLAVIAMQAGVAAHVLERDPARARELLGTVVATSREALDGLRADLDRLRTPGAGAARRPAPGLADLPLLLDRMRDGGLRLDVSLDEATVSPEVGAAAYRIVQESLTNVLRHAGTSEASVRVRRDGGLLIEVADRGLGTVGRSGSGGPGSDPSAGLGRVPRTFGGADRPRSRGQAPGGPGEPGTGAAVTGGTGTDGTGTDGTGTDGTGIAGMRRRAESVGGRLSAGPRDGGGFVVRAELPA